MDGFQARSSDHGTLGPGSDVANSDAPSRPTQLSEESIPADAISPSSATAAPSDSSKRPAGNLRLPHLIAVMIGFGCAFLVSNARGPAGLRGKVAGPNPPRQSSHASSATLSDRDLDRQKPQRQAEILLERAVAQSAGTPDQIESQSEDRGEPQSETLSEPQAQIRARLENWRGKLQWDERLGQLTTAALNSNSRSVRASAVEVQLAAYGLPETESSVDALVQQADSSDHAQKIWALWALGLLGNRGVEADRVVQVLSAHLKSSVRNSDRNADQDKNRNDNDQDTRRWAVEGLALAGTTPTIAPLLEALHNDPSPTVRERAACSLAESGMLSHEQRLIAVPQLINDSDDPALDAQTHSWAYQALTDITRQHLPNDSAAWREWYEKTVVSGQ